MALQLVLLAWCFGVTTCMKRLSNIAENFYIIWFARLRYPFLERYYGFTSSAWTGTSLLVIHVGVLGGVIGIAKVLGKVLHWEKSTVR